MRIVPDKLQKGDKIRVIAPSRTLSIVSEKNIRLARAKLEEQGFKISFSKNCRESDLFLSSSIKSRVDDLHDAFKDKKVKAIFTAIGGFNANQMIEHLDYDLIKRNPKIFCGYSDITVLSNAITAKTGMITYSGLHFSTWAMKKEFDYNLEYFKKCLVSEGAFKIYPSDNWTEDSWYEDQENRRVEKNQGFIVINEGEAGGVVFGGNLCSFNLLNGTDFAPDISNSILFLEDDNMVGDLFGEEFDRNLQSLAHQKNFKKVKAIIVGRFQSSANMTLSRLKHIIQKKKALKNIPIIANVDFGHTNPIITFPIGGTAKLSARKKGASLEIIQH